MKKEEAIERIQNEKAPLEMVVGFLQREIQNKRQFINEKREQIRQLTARIFELDEAPLDFYIDERGFARSKGDAETLENLRKAVNEYLKANDDQLGIFTEIANVMGFKDYPSQSMMGEDICHYIDGDGHLITIIYNEWPDEEDLMNIRGEEIDES